MKKTIVEIESEVINIIKSNPVLALRYQALIEAGYPEMKYQYVKHGKGCQGIQYMFKKGGIGNVERMNRKKIFRIQVEHTEIKKRYPAAWCIDIPFTDVDMSSDDWYTDLPF